MFSKDKVLEVREKNKRLIKMLLKKIKIDVFSQFLVIFYQIFISLFFFLLLDADSDTKCYELSEFTQCFV